MGKGKLRIPARHSRLECHNAGICLTGIGHPINIRLEQSMAIGCILHCDSDREGNRQVRTAKIEAKHQHVGLRPRLLQRPGVCEQHC